MRRHTTPRGFTLLELGVVGGILLLLAAVIFFGVMAGKRNLKTNSQLNTCLKNLKAIGVAEALYVTENNGKIPYAGIRTERGHQISWDDLLSRKLGGSTQPGHLDSPIMPVQLKVLQCPSDKLTELSPDLAKRGAHRRSYAMPTHNMSDANWPPGPDNKTGLGLSWDLGPSRYYVSSRKRWETPSTTNEFNPVQLSYTRDMISLPAATILITERVQTNNVIGSANAVTIDNATEHVHYRTSLNAHEFHQGKFNYLFVDGHVDTLEPLKTLGRQNQSPAIQSGMWTVSPND